MTRWQSHRRGLAAVCEERDTPDGRELAVILRGLAINNEMMRAVPARKGLEEEWRQMLEGAGWTHDPKDGPPI